MFYVLVGVVVGYVDGIVYIILLLNLIKWFLECKGLIVGIFVFVYGLGSLIFKYVNV